MKKISVLFILALLACTQTPCNAGIFAAHKARIEQNKIYNQAVDEIKIVLSQQDKHANEHNALALSSLYSNDFVNSDGFNKDVYFKLINETWKTYPDIAYSTKINNIEITGNYATVFVTETAVATSKEQIGDLETIGELYSTSRCVYYLEKHGTIWLINSERIIDEFSTLKFGSTRYMDIKLIAPKQVNAGKYYTVTLKTNAPKNTISVGSISKENIVYPQGNPDDTFRKLNSDNILERVFPANKDNVNENIIASVGVTQAENYDEKHIKVYMTGLAFIMTRVNVIPENKFIKQDKPENKESKNNEQSK